MGGWRGGWNDILGPYVFYIEKKGGFIFYRCTF